MFFEDIPPEDWIGHVIAAKELLDKLACLLLVVMHRPCRPGLA